MDEKPNHVVVVAVDGQPCALQTLPGKGFPPLCSQGALAIAGRCMNEDQLWSPSRAKAVEDSLPRDRRAIERGRTKPRRCARRVLRSPDRARPIRPQSECT